MAFPPPVPGLVIRYSYLWADEHTRGREEGVKDRPCAIVLVVGGERRLGLDDARSWVALTEANRFVWPGPDLRPLAPGDAGTVAYGLLPYALFENIRLKFIAALKLRTARTVPRT